MICVDKYHCEKNKLFQKNLCHFLDLSFQTHISLSQYKLCYLKDIILKTIMTSPPSEDIRRPLTAHLLLTWNSFTQFNPCTHFCSTIQATILWLILKARWLMCITPALKLQIIHLAHWIIYALHTVLWSQEQYAGSQNKQQLFLEEEESCWVFIMQIHYIFYEVRT